MRTQEYDELKEEIIQTFKEGNDLQDILHEILDDFVTNISNDLLNAYLTDFNDSDIETLDKGLYEGVLEKRGYNTFKRVLLYCLIEQDLYNEEDFSKLQ